MDNNFIKKGEIKTDFSEKILKNVFVKNITVNKNQISKNFLFESLDSKATELLDKAKSGDVYYIITNKLNPNSIKKQLNEALETGATFYLISSEANLLKEYYGKILIREPEDTLGISMFLRERNGEIEGFLGEGSIQDKKETYIFNPDTDQAKELKKYFVNNFWNNTSKEYIKDEEKKANSLYDNYLYNTITVGDDRILDTFEDFLLNNRGASCFYNNSLKYNSLEDGNLFFDLENRKSFKEAINIDEESEVYILDEGRFNNLFFTEEEGYYISKFPIDKNSFIITLSKKQLIELNNLIPVLKEDSSYKFFKNTMVKNIHKSFLYIDKPEEKFNIEEVYTKEIESVRLQTIEEYLNFDLTKHLNSKVEFRLDKPALTYIYKGEYHPPYLPTKAKASKLTREWENLERDIKKHISSEIIKLNESISQIEDKSGIIFNLYKKFKIGSWNKDVEKLETLRDRDIKNLKYSNIKEMISSMERLTKENIYNEEEINLKIEENKWNSEKDNTKKESEIIREEVKEANNNLEIAIKTNKSEKENLLESLRSIVVEELNGKKLIVSKDIKTLNELQQHLSSNIDALYIENEKKVQLIEEEIEKEIAIIQGREDIKFEKEKERIKERKKIETEELKNKNKKSKHKTGKNILEEPTHIKITRESPIIKQKIKEIKSNIKIISDSELSITQEIVELLGELSVTLSKQIFEDLNLKKKKAKFTKDMKTNKVLKTLDKSLENSDKNLVKIQDLLNNTNSLSDFESLNSFVKKNQLRELNYQDKLTLIENTYNKVVKNKDFLEDKLDNTKAKLEKLGSKFGKEISKNKEGYKIPILIPSEDRNRVGELFEHNNERYLAINQSNDLEEAIKEGKRLEAKVCIMI